VRGPTLGEAPDPDLLVVPGVVLGQEKPTGGVTGLAPDQGEREVTRGVQCPRGDAMQPTGLVLPPLLTKGDIVDTLQDLKI